jgi:hypothetical protein
MREISFSPIGLAFRSPILRDSLQQCLDRGGGRDLGRGLASFGLPTNCIGLPPAVRLYTPDQVFYFDSQGLQRRLDYIVEINGSTLVGHYTSRYQNFHGPQVATRRRVFRRNPDNTVNLNLPSITLDIHFVELIRRDEQAQP